MAWLVEQRVRFRPSFDGSRLAPSRAVVDHPGGHHPDEKVHVVRPLARLAGASPEGLVDRRGQVQRFLETDAADRLARLTCSSLHQQAQEVVGNLDHREGLDRHPGCLHVDHLEAERGFKMGSGLSD